MGRAIELLAALGPIIVPIVTKLLDVLPMWMRPKRNKKEEESHEVPSPGAGQRPARKQGRKADH